MDKFIRIISSRTVLTAIAVVIVNGVPALRDSIPAEWLPVVNSILGLLAAYFRITPRQPFGAK